MESFLFINNWKAGLTQFLCRPLFHTISQLTGIATFDILHILHALQPASNMNTAYNHTNTLRALEFAAGTLIVLVVNILDVIFKGRLLYTAMCLVIQGIRQRRRPCDTLDALVLCALFFQYHAQSVAEDIHRCCLEIDRYIQVNVLDPAASFVESYARAFLGSVQDCYRHCCDNAECIDVTSLLSTVSFIQDYARFVVCSVQQWYQTLCEVHCDLDRDGLKMQDGSSLVEIIIQEPGEAAINIQMLVHDENAEVIFRNEKLELCIVAVPTLSMVAGGISRSVSWTISMKKSGKVSSHEACNECHEHEGARDDNDMDSFNSDSDGGVALSPTYHNDHDTGNGNTASPRYENMATGYGLGGIVGYDRRVYEREVRGCNSEDPPSYSESCRLEREHGHPLPFGSPSDVDEDEDETEPEAGNGDVAGDDKSPLEY